jgi:dTDP-4-dehydrorhamnose reductase
MKKYLILGGTGLLGSKLIELIENSFGTYFQSQPVTGLNFYYLDASNIYEFDLLLNKLKPDVVVNCIGYTNVDKCEITPEKSWKINCELALNFAKVCEDRSIKFVQISTDHYLSNTNKRISEVDRIKPVNQYSFSKYYAENILLQNNTKALIIRMNFFHFNSQNPKTFLDKLIFHKDASINLLSFNDVIISPISTIEFTKCLFSLVSQNISGLVNVSSNETISKYDFHEAVLKAIGIDSGFHIPTSINLSNLSATRPKFMALDNSRLCGLINGTVPSIYDMIEQEILASKIREEFHNA